MNKRQFLSIRNNFVAQAKHDIAVRIRQFMSDNRMSKEMVADTLGLSVTNVNNILNENDSVRLLDYISVLAAFGLTICVQTMNEVQQESAPQREVRNSGCGARPAQSTQRSTSGPSRDSRGRFVSQRNTERVVCEEAQHPNIEEDIANLDSMTRNQLVDLVLMNHWEDGIDLIRAEKSQLIAFLAERMRASVPTEEGAAQPCFDDAHDGGSTVLGALFTELANNPTLRQQLRSMLG